MSYACAPILVGVTSPVLEIPLLSKMAKFPFRPMVIKKFNWSDSAQIIHASRDWCHMHVHWSWWAWLLWFRRYRYTQKWPNFPFDPWSSKNLIDCNRLKKFMQVGIDELCMCTNFGGRSLSGFGDIATFLFSSIFPWWYGKIIMGKFLQFSHDMIYFMIMYASSLHGCSL